MSSGEDEEESLESHVKGLVLKKQIGKGSCGKVYKAVWNGSEVAAKRFHSVFFENNGFTQMVEQNMQTFQREWDVLKLLNHANVVKLHTVVFPKGYSPIIITELLHCDLERYIKQSNSSPKIPNMNLTCIALDVIQGLQYMHSLSPPVVHRDLATKNILLTVNGTAKIADMGVAKGFAAGCEMYATRVPGTPVYAAPETYPVMRQYKVISDAKYGPKVDIFSFGAVLLAMIVGHEPVVWPMTLFTEGGEMFREHDRRKTDILEMGDHALKDLVLRCLENDSNCRQSATDIKEELEKHKWNLVHSESNEMDEEAVIEKVGRQPSYDYRFKILFIGDSGVGKSCLFQRFQNPKYNILMSRLTAGVEIDTESFKYGSKFVHLKITDTAGQERQFCAVQPMYFRGTHGIFLVCDVTYRETFDHIPRWLDLARLYCTENNALIIVIGNKIDQVEKRQVSYDEGQALAKCHGLSYMEASALDVGRIEDMYRTMIQLLTRSVDLGSITIELRDTKGKVKLKKLPRKSKCQKCSKE